MTVKQHKKILEEVLSNKFAFSLIGSPKMRAYILEKTIEDLKRRHKAQMLSASH